MTNRIKKSAAAVLLALSLGGGGAMLAANTHIIASVSNASDPFVPCEPGLKCVWQ